MSKITLTHKILFLFFSFFLGHTAFAQSKTCNVELHVEKNRNIRSTPKTGTFYKISLTNLGNSTDTFLISTANINNRCNGLENRSDYTTQRSVLKANILDITQKSGNGFTLNPGESITFLVKIIVPENTAINSWCCTEIVAQSSNCSSVTASTTLQTLVINSTEE